MNQKPGTAATPELSLKIRLRLGETALRECRKAQRKGAQYIKAAEAAAKVGDRAECDWFLMLADYAIDRSKSVNRTVVEMFATT